MFAKRFKCKVIENIWISPSVFTVRFSVDRKIRFAAGQFISIYVPTEEKTLRRCYSLSSAPGEDTYLLCIKHVKGGAGSTYMASLKAGEDFEATAPYGDFLFRPPEVGRGVVFVATGTGVAPIVSMLKSSLFRESHHSHCTVIIGVKDEKEMLFHNELRKLGVEVVYTLSKPSENWFGFSGRVTDYLDQLPKAWHWQNSDFYICGSGEMVNDVVNILRGGHGVPRTSINVEAFSSGWKSARRERPEASSLLTRSIFGSAG